MNASRIPKVGFLVVLAGFAMSATSHAVPKCSISIKEELKNGQAEVTAFKSDLTSQAACATLAKMHEKNFAPDRIRNKSVFYSWNGAKSSKAPMLAAHKKRSKKKPTTLAVRRTRSRNTNSL